MAMAARADIKPKKPRRVQRWRPATLAARAIVHLEAGMLCLADRGFFGYALWKQAASTGAAIGHQVHGAMGYTYEHRLHHFTRRLWAWRDEWGNEFYWQAKLGQHLAGLGADQVWGFIATPS